MLSFDSLREVLLATHNLWSSRGRFIRILARDAGLGYLAPGSISVVMSAGTFPSV